MQGAGGVIPPGAEYFPKLREICDRHDVLLIADEVITGFGRTGRWFALRHWDVQPDIVTFAKAVTSAYIPLSGAIVSKDDPRGASSQSADDRFMHGFTNSAHPAACAVGLRNLQIFDDENLVENAAVAGRSACTTACARCSDEDGVGDVRGLGLIAGVELCEDKEKHKPFPRRAQRRRPPGRRLPERGLISRNLGRQLPPGAAAGHDAGADRPDRRDPARVDPRDGSLGAQEEAGDLGSQAVPQPRDEG